MSHIQSTLYNKAYMRILWIKVQWHNSTKLKMGASRPMHYLPMLIYVYILKDVSRIILYHLKIELD